MVQVMMKAENLTEDLVAAAKEPGFKDLGGVGSTSSTIVEFEKPVAVDVGTTSRAWLWTARITNLPANSSQKRRARLTFGKVEQFIEYIVTNQSPANFTWSVAAPATPWLVRVGPLSSQLSTTVVVTTGDYPASNLRLAQSTLRDGLGTSQIGLEDLELCDGPTGQCSQLSINARANRTFYIKLKPAKSWWMWRLGKYTGTLSFAVNERPELQTVNVILQASSWIAKLVGAVLVAFGIWLAWRAGVRARARLLRLEALKAVMALQESITSLLGELKKVKDRIGEDIPGDVKKSIGAKLDEISKSLTPEALDVKDCLPPATPRPYSGGPDTSANLKAHLTEQGKCVAALTILTRDGMNKVLEDWRPPLQDPKKQAIMKALQALNEKGFRIVDIAAAELEVKDVLKQYYTETNRVADAASPPRIAPLSSQYLSWEIGQIYTKGWLIWGVLTWLGGVAVLILINPGFGTPLDLLFCLFWGFGLPAGIDKLQQLSPASVASSIGVTVPKASQ
jgi:hypothetical protein